MTSLVKLSRPSRLVAAFLTLFSMLFMQLALASYVCPGKMMGNVSNGMSGMSKSVSTMPMLNCEGMDSEQPALCHAHAEDALSKQSLDKPIAPDVPAFIMAGLVLTLTIIDSAEFPQEPEPQSLLLMRSTAPPIAIRNCCFRI
ncbi:hypothetical protein QN395_14710 [Undibacterium sp. RTI2.2]|nr:hypothetical protein [Undibacterium sp. RTI2.2]